jgi:hypothetical protein
MASTIYGKLFQSVPSIPCNTSATLQLKTYWLCSLWQEIGYVELTNCLRQYVVTGGKDNSWPTLFA